jgi:hypothetical protein
MTAEKNTVKECLDALASESREWLPVALSPSGGLLIGFPGSQGTVRWLEVTLEHAQQVLRNQLTARERGEKALGTPGSPTAAQLRHEAWHRKGQYSAGCKWCAEAQREVEAEAVQRAERKALREAMRARKPKITLREAFAGKPTQSELKALGI